MFNQKTIPSNNSYRDMTDEELVYCARNGDEIALEMLMNRYKTFVKSKAHTYFLVGADREDIVQEGMIGLYKAVRDYDKNKQTLFKGFADLCVTRHIITAIKTATRQKHIPLNSYVSLNKPVFESDNERTLIDTVTIGAAADPEQLILSKEKIAAIETKMGRVLSKLEINVVNLYLEGKSYTEIARILDRDIKSIDNALQRVKKKIGKRIIEDY